MLYDNHSILSWSVACESVGLCKHFEMMPVYR